jgi:hypothetical protein
MHAYKLSSHGVIIGFRPASISRTLGGTHGINGMLMLSLLSRTGRWWNIAASAERIF